MPGGVRITPQQVRSGGRWWYLAKDGGNTQKPQNRLDLFTGKTSKPQTETSFSSKSSPENNTYWGNGRK